jgi:hypothetical protein
MFPLIDASIIGFTTGTFDIVVNARFDENMKTYISEYPVLVSVQVDEAILPQWVRPENREAK